MKYAGQSKRNALIIAILAIAAVAIYNWFVTPQTRYLAAAQKYKETVDSMKQASIIMSKNQKLNRKELDEHTQQFEQQKQDLFDVNEAKDFLANLQSAAEKSDCTVANLKHSSVREIAVKDSNSVSVYFYQNQVNMRFLGRYENIIEFLNTIQNRTAKVWIDSINISMKNITSNYLTCDTVLSIYTMDIKEIQNNVDSKK
jgi:Tfp pilus assembly protein PilO